MAGCTDKGNDNENNGPVPLTGAIVNCDLMARFGDAVRTNIIPAQGDKPARKVVDGSFSSLVCNDVEIDVVNNRITKNLLETEKYGGIQVRSQGSGVSLWSTAAQVAMLRKDTRTNVNAKSASINEFGIAHKVVSVLLENGDMFEMEFQYVPSGCFDMGDGFGVGVANEAPAHTVCIDGFYLGKYEVTQDQWSKIIGKVEPRDKCNGGECPVGNVTWYDAKAYATTLAQLTGLGFRLPTEAEWEYACRSGGKNEQFAGSNDAEDVAWHSGIARGNAHSVGLKLPNGFELYDMSGNVSEFVEDAYSESAYARHTRENPVFRGIRSKHIIRGGNYYYDGGAEDVRCAVRHTADLTDHYSNYGFRLVMIQ